MEEGLAIILQRPQLAENIGMVARAMANCGVVDLRLINPVCGWPNRKAELSSAEKLDLVNVSCFESLIDAIADLNFVFATSARSHCMIKQFISPYECAKISANKIMTGARVGILFGPENNGLSNKDISFCNMITCIESQNFSSYNLAQAVLIICYAFMIEVHGKKSSDFHVGDTILATKREVGAFVEFLEKKLEMANYFSCGEKREKMVITLKNFFMRGDITKQEINSLFGAINCLCKRGDNYG